MQSYENSKLEAITKDQEDKLSKTNKELENQ